jgi:ribose-phosphate pyrophosphokinase
MIKLYTEQGIEIPYTLTRFPDGSQQAWKICPGIVNKIEWIYKDDSELLVLLELLVLINTIQSVKPILYIPFFPHARQDKPISNESTFSKKIICDILLKTYKNYYSYIETIDVHSNVDFKIFNEKISNIIPDFITIINKHYDLICFPDKGASKRHYNTHDIPSFSLDKLRNQDTGEITGLTCSLPLDLTHKSILIVDDICDGGKTFIEATKVLKTLGAKAIDLYTSHGIYSKGTDILRESGICNIYNYKGEVND